MVADRSPAAELTRSWEGLGKSLTREHDLEPLEIEGEIPAGLRGVMYRNGPALFEAPGGERYDHPFDGDGAITMVRIGEGRAHGAVRVIESEGLVHERKLGRRRYGNYGTISPRPFWDFWFGTTAKNVANTSVMLWQGRLLALWEGGKPTELDPATLVTKGVTDLGAVPGTFSAHPHYVPGRKAVYNFGVRYGRQTMLDIFELPDLGPTRLVTSIELAGATMVHDFIATERHLIFFAPPLNLSIWPVMWGQKSFADAFEWSPERGTEVIVVPIDSPQTVRRFTVDAFYQWHFANAFEQGNELVVDFCRYPDFSTNQWLKQTFNGGEPMKTESAYVRGRLDLGAGKLRTETLFDTSCEFPIVAPRTLTGEHRYTWMAAHSSNDATAGGPLDRLVKLDTQTGETRTLELGARHYPLEPLFAERPGATDEDDGWLLALTYDGNTDRSYVAAIDAREMTVVAKAWFDHAIPMTFHGQWYGGS